MLWLRQGRQCGELCDGHREDELSRSIASSCKKVQHRDHGKGANTRADPEPECPGKPARCFLICTETFFGKFIQYRRRKIDWDGLLQRARFERGHHPEVPAR